MDVTRSILLILSLVFLFSIQNIMFCLGMICKQIERRALLSFKQDLKNSSNSLASWSDENCCRWAGIRCNNTTGHVTELHLRGLRLGGELNPSLLELKQLTHVDLSFNDFEGISIPYFLGSLQSLRYLNLSRAGFCGTIPHQLGNLSNLRALDISYSNNNHFNYQVPRIVAGNFQWLSHLSSLQYLDLSYMNVTNASSFLYAISMLPSLLVLRLSQCGLDALPSLSYANFTSLAVLDLQGNRLNSSIPQWLYSLTNLEQLDLSFNYFQGTISVSIGNLTKLTLLDLSLNQLEGEIPITLGNLCKMQRLDLSTNNLKGEILEFLGSSIGCITKSLKSLVLDRNKLSGPLPDELGRLRNLNQLSLEGNQFSGPIPFSIGRLSLLEELVLGFNNFNGSLPESLGNLSKLERLYINSNAFEGVVSEVQFSNLTNLKYLDMSTSSNINSLVLKMSPEWVPPFQLSLAILKNIRVGPGFPIWIRTQKTLNQLDLSRTGISGTIPTWFWNFSSVEDFNVDLSHNELHGELPKVINATSIYLGSNQFNGKLPLVSPTVKVLDLSNNLFSVSVSTFLCNPISESNHLEILVLSNNRITGDLSDCWVYWINLKWLSLGKNQITGKIPSSMGSLRQLEELHLQKNNLFGELPSSLRNCTSLNIVDFGENGFTGRLPTWIGESLLRLKFLRLRSNMFCDEVPTELCHLASIQVLDIAHNHLQGVIPRCFTNFSAMASNNTPVISKWQVFDYEKVYGETTLVYKGRELQYDIFINEVRSLDLSTNKFSGEIPEEITSLIGLHSLNLSENHFIGNIPEMIGNMNFLESLDFSNNSISGIIPPSISNISFLSYLNLSYNNLSGTIPLGGQFQTFDEFSFIGNQGLCGPPLNKCNEDEPPQKFGDGEREIEDEVWFEMKWFYMSIVVGFSLGYWAFWGVMVLNLSWRIAYFRFLDDTNDKLCLLF